MGEFTVYSIKGALMLTILFAAYKLTIVSSKHFGIRRTVLLLIYLCAILIPLADFLPEIDTGHNPGGFSIEDAAAVAIISPATGYTPQQDSGMLFRILGMAIVAGVVVNILLATIALLRIARYRNAGRMENVFGMRVAVIDNNSITPFTFGSVIYLSQKEYEEKDPMILTHEHCHKVKRHYLDLILGRAIACLMWWNPFAWLMLRELHDVHEYQADEYVLSYGFDMKGYQYLLIKKAAGSRLQTFADSLNHSKLKKRLTMMKKSKKKGGAAAVALMIPAVIAGGLLMSSPTLASMLEPMRNADLSFADREAPQPDSKVSDFSAEPQIISILNTDAADASDTPSAVPQDTPTERKEPHPGDQNDKPASGNDGKEKGQPAFKIDGKLMPESFDMNSINPNDIESITVLKDNEDEYPNGLIVIELKKDSESNANVGNSDEPLKVIGFGSTLKDGKETVAKFIPNVYIVNHIDNMKGSNFTLTIVPGNGMEVEIKGVQLRLNGKTYDADSVSSSFSKSNDESIQKVEIHLNKTFKKFDPNKDKIIVHTADSTIELPIHIV